MLLLREHGLWRCGHVEGLLLWLLHLLHRLLLHQLHLDGLKGDLRLRLQHGVLLLLCRLLSDGCERGWLLRQRRAGGIALCAAQAAAVVLR